MDPQKRTLLLDLYAVGVLKLGTFVLKGGHSSPVYVDLRLLISYPPLMKRIVRALSPLLCSLQYDLICGVPYAAIPVATACSLELDIPMLLCRKEAKEHGTKKRIEGVFHKGQRCLLIEDVVTAGSSLIDTARTLTNEGLIIREAVVLIDREQGGKEQLQTAGISLHSLSTLSTFLQVPLEEKKISEEVCREVATYVSTHRA